MDDDEKEGIECITADMKKQIFEELTEKGVSKEVLETLTPLVDDINLCKTKNEEE